MEDRYGNKRMITHTRTPRADPRHQAAEAGLAPTLRKMLSTFVENTMALGAMGYDVNSSDFVWVHVIAKKLDPASRREWELHHGGEDVQTMDAMKQFLEERARALEFAIVSLEKTAVKTPRDKEKKEVQVNLNRPDGLRSCQKCSAEHGLYVCEQFKALSFEEKSSFINEKGLCFNCLRSGHSSKDCKSKAGCRICRKRHLLHRPSDLKNNDPNPQTCLWHWGDTWCGATLCTNGNGQRANFNKSRYFTFGVAHSFPA